MDQMSWQVNGFKSKEEAALFAIAAVMKQVPGAAISYAGESWMSENFSKDYLRTVKPKFFKPVKKERKN